MTQPDRKFFFVMATGDHRPNLLNGEPCFRRRGLTFLKQKFKPLELGTTDNLDADPPIVSPETFAAIQAETESKPVPPNERPRESTVTETGAMLLMRAATADEVFDHITKQKALRPRDRIEELEDRAARLEAKNTELEDRLMKSELAQPEQKPAKGGRS